MFVNLSALFSFTEDRLDDFVSPMPKRRPPAAAPAAARTEQWSNDHIRLVFEAELPEPYASVAKLLILTGQRRGEIASIRQSWISADGSHILVPKTKNSLPQIVPLAPMARAIIEARLAAGIPGGLLFTLDGRNPVENFATLVRALDRASVQAGLGPRFPMLHSARRTVITRMHALRIDESTVHAVANHAATGVHDLHYNRHAYYGEKLEAFSAWERELAVIVAGTKIVKLGREPASA
jgi:integrase